MKKKKKILFGLAIITLVLSIGFVLSVEKKADSKMQSKRSEQVAVFIQDAEGNYQVNNADTFPTKWYVLNTEKSICQNGSTLTQDETTKSISLSVSQSEVCTLYFDKEVFSIPKAVNSILNDKPVAGIKSENPTFANAATTDEGVYAMADDYGISYYYRGAVTNNYVKFADKFWRIIRVNGDGSLRMIYDGTHAYANRTNDVGRQALTSIAFNTSYNDAKYVGYMYGPEGATLSESYAQATTNTVSSNIKIQVDNWYKTNIVDAGYSKYVSDEIFCNDRSISGTPQQWWTSERTNIGYGTNVTAYGAFSRFLNIIGNWSSTPAPKFACTNKNDAFTVSDTTKGNGALTYPVGLITADEIVAAGSGKGGTPNSSYYLYKGSWYWSLSPRHFNSGYAYVFNVFSSGSLYSYGVNNAYAVAPVINLSSEFIENMTGDGSMTNPYSLS